MKLVRPRNAQLTPRPRNPWADGTTMEPSNWAPCLKDSHSRAMCYYKVRPSHPCQSGDGRFTVHGIAFLSQRLLDQFYDLIVPGNTWSMSPRTHLRDVSQGLCPAAMTSWVNHGQRRHLTFFSRSGACLSIHCCKMFFYILQAVLTHDDAKTWLKFMDSSFLQNNFWSYTVKFWQVMILGWIFTLFTLRE